jgi:hypothetical protein
LRRLHRILDVGRIERHGEPDDYKWAAEGRIAIEKVLEVVGPWLGTVKREQARDSMRAFTGQVRLKGNGTHRKRGHAYDRRVTRNGRTRVFLQHLSTAQRAKQRALLGIAPRQFRNVARRYTE